MALVLIADFKTRKSDSTMWSQRSALDGSKKDEQEFWYWLDEGDLQLNYVVSLPILFKAIVLFKEV